MNGFPGLNEGLWRVVGVLARDEARVIPRVRPSVTKWHGRPSAKALPWQRCAGRQGLAIAKRAGDGCRNLRMQFPMVIIAAMSRDRVMGSGDGMPWHVPAEYEQYLGQVAGQTMLMGRRSYEIFGRDLATTELVVVSRSLRRLAGACVAASFDEAVDRARQTQRTIFIGGGSEIYRQGLAVADRMHLSVIPGNYIGDTWFPEFDAADWELELEEARAGYDYFEYARR